MKARKGISKQTAFLAAFRITASITAAAAACKIERQLHYRWLAEPEYVTAFAQAKEEAAQTLEDEAVRRAKEGVEEPVIWKGEFCYERDSRGRRRLKKPLFVRKHSDALMIFLLKGFRPDKYRESFKAELSGPNGGPVEIVERLNAARKRMGAAGE